jgi:hypothetical protein
MSLISIIGALIIVGVVLWLINTLIPMDRKIKTILNVVVVIVVLACLLNSFGVFGTQSSMHIGNLHMRW